MRKKRYPLACHSCEGGNPPLVGQKTVVEFSRRFMSVERWIPAFAGMTCWGVKNLCILLSVLFLLAGCGGSNVLSGKLVKQYGGEKTRPDKVSERYVSLRHPKSGEKISLTYYKNGKYSDSAMKAIKHIFRDRRTDEVGNIDPELIDFLVDIRTRLYLPPTVVFEILSGYRSAESNALLAKHNKKVAQESLHIHGWAVDFRIVAVNGSAIAEIAKTMQRGGVSFYPASNHVHVDIGNIRTWPTK